jgi:hypothetical protein
MVLISSSALNPPISIKREAGGKVRSRIPKNIKKHLYHFPKLKL